MLRKFSLSMLIPVCMLGFYIALVAVEYWYESDLVENQLAQRQVNLIKLQLSRMQSVVQSAQAIQDIERIEQEVSLAAADKNLMVYILLDANSRIRFANHSVWQESNAVQVIDGYDVHQHFTVVQSQQPQITLNRERLTIQAYYPLGRNYPGGVELIYLESDLAPVYAEASNELLQRFLRIWGLGGLFLLFVCLILYILVIRPFKVLTSAATHIGTAEFSVGIPCGTAEALSLQTSLVQVHNRLERAIKKLSDSELRWLFAIEGSRNGIWDWELHSGAVFLSDRWKEMIGYRPDELDGVFQTWESRLHPDDRQAVLDALQDYICGKRDEFESVHRLLHRDGHYIWVLDRGMLVDWDHQGRPTRMLGIHVDVSESEKNHAVIADIVRQSAAQDGILPEAFRAQLVQLFCASSEAKHWSGLFSLELDNLGLDNLPMAERKHLYAQLSARLSSYFTDKVIFAHIELGHFSVFANGLAQDAEMAGRRALALVSELKQVLARPCHSGEHHFSFNANIGIYLFDNSAPPTPERVIQNARLALQQAKSVEAEGFAFYHPDLETASTTQNLLSQTLKAAIDDGELSLMFQPVVDASGKITSAEVLSRWYLPNGDVVPATEFIRLAERDGLIATLDLKVAERVCCLIKQSEQQGWNVPRLTLNVSSLSFCQVDFVEQLIGLVRRYELLDQQIGIELNESALLAPKNFVLPRLLELKNAGVTITWDDFGAEKTALGCLTLYPIDEIKLAISCAESLAAHPSWPQALIQAVQPYKIRVVAKGVESPLQQQIFATLGCAYYQGYSISRALFLADFKQLVCPRPLLRSV